MAYKLKIAKEGDVREITDPEKLRFDSGKSILGLRGKQKITESTDVNGKIDTSYTHGLGYVPIVLVFVTTIDGKKVAVPNKWESDYVPDTDFVLEENFYFYVDDDKVYVKSYTHRYEPIMGGDDFDINGQSYTFEIMIYFNELNDEF